MVSRYFGLRAYGEIYGCMFAIFTVGTGLGPVLMGLSFDETRSYKVALAVFGVALSAPASWSRGSADTTSRPPRTTVAHIVRVTHGNDVEAPD